MEKDRLKVGMNQWITEWSNSSTLVYVLEIQEKHKKSTLSFRIEHKNYIKFVYQSNFALLYLITFLTSPMKYLILNLVAVLFLIWLVFIEVFDAADPSLLEKFCVCDSCQ